MAYCSTVSPAFLQLDSENSQGGELFATVVTIIIIGAIVLWFVRKFIRDVRAEAKKRLLRDLLIKETEAAVKKKLGEQIQAGFRREFEKRIEEEFNQERNRLQREGQLTPEKEASLKAKCDAMGQGASDGFSKGDDDTLSKR